MGGERELARERSLEMRASGQNKHWSGFFFFLSQSLSLTSDDLYIGLRTCNLREAFLLRTEMVAIGVRVEASQKSQRKVTIEKLIEHTIFHNENSVNTD